MLNTGRLFGAKPLAGRWCGNRGVFGADLVEYVYVGGLLILNTVLFWGLVGCTPMVHAKGAPDTFVWVS